MQVPVWFHFDLGRRCVSSAEARLICAENMDVCGICQLLSCYKWYHQSHTLSVSCSGFTVWLQTTAGQSCFMFESCFPCNTGHQFVLVVLKRMSVMCFLHVYPWWFFSHGCRIYTSPVMGVFILVPHWVWNCICTWWGSRNKGRAAFDQGFQWCLLNVQFDQITSSLVLIHGLSWKINLADTMFPNSVSLGFSKKKKVVLLGF